MKKVVSRVIPLLLLVAVISGAVYYLNNITAEEAGPFQVSGTVETVRISIAPEVGGRVVDVLVSEGEQVHSGQLLIQLDDALLQTQLHQARAALNVARANFDMVAAGTTPETQQAAIAAASFQLLTARQALDRLNDNADLEAALLLQSVANAEKAVDDAQRRFDNLNTASDQADIDGAYANLILTKDKLDKADEAFDPYRNKPDTNVTKAAYQSKLAQAQLTYDAAVRKYNNLTGTANAIDLSKAAADLELAKVQLADLQDRYEIKKNGPDPDDVALAEAQIANAEAQLALAQAENPTAEQLAVSQAQLDLAQSNLEIIQVQIDQTQIYAPADGVVISRLVEPGELALPNTILLELAQLQDLTVTVYLPEDRYGLVLLGQVVEVTSDSFAGVVFSGQVVYIADEAEFTPRNVQTAEGRRTTVFAVKLSVEDTGGRLKPGMPVDVILSDL